MKTQFDWRSLLIPPSLPLAEAVALLDKGAKRILLVTAPDDTLLGTLTDGDIRRALIRKMDLSIPASAVMNSSPRCATARWSKTRLLSFMEKTDLLQLPILDDNQKVVGICFLYDLLKRPRIDNPVCIMAGGFGTRLKPLTDLCPKPMLKIGDKPILEIILERFIAAGFWNFYISTHYKADMIKDYFGDGKDRDVQIHYLSESEPLGTAGALSLLPKEDIRAPLILMNGDLLTNLDFLSLLSTHESTDADLTVCLRQYEHQVPFGVVNTEGGWIRSIVEKPIHKYHVNAGIYVITPHVLGRIMYGQKIDMPTLVSDLLNERKPVGYFEISEDWLDIGRLDDFQRAQKLMMESFGDI
jgi:dTDP-glucose pyrophosphorylase/CBS domain-containing protein